MGVPDALGRGSVGPLGCAALPFVCALAPSERYAQERGRRHRPLYGVGMADALVRKAWQPGREIVAVADGGYASLKLLDRCRHLGRPITFITRLRLDAALYEPAPPRKPKQSKTSPEGRRLATSRRCLGPEAGLDADHARSRWYGDVHDARGVRLRGGRLVRGTSRVPIRWVLIRDRRISRASLAVRRSLAEPARIDRG